MLQRKIFNSKKRKRRKRKRIKDRWSDSLPLLISSTSLTFLGERLSQGSQATI